MFGFGQLGRDVSFIELLEKNKLLNDDDASDPHASLPDYDLDEFSEQEFDGLDISLVTPFSEFFFKFLKFYYGQIVEKLMTESRFNVGAEEDPAIIRLFQKTAIQWQNIQTMFDEVLAGQQELTHTIKEWKKQMGEVDLDRDSSVQSDFMIFDSFDDRAFLNEILPPINYSIDRLSYEYAGADIEDATVQDFHQPGAWLPTSEIFRRNQRRLSVVDEQDTYRHNFDTARSSADNLQNRSIASRYIYDVMGLLTGEGSIRSWSETSQPNTARDTGAGFRRSSSFNQNRTGYNQNQNYNHNERYRRNWGNNRGRNHQNPNNQNGPRNTANRPQYDERGRFDRNERRYNPPSNNPNRSRRQDDFINSNYNSSGQNFQSFHRRR